MKEQLLNAWRTNNKHNLLLIENISDTGFNASMSKRGGRTVGQQLVHMHNVRLTWLEQCAKDLLAGTSPLDKDEKIDGRILSAAFKSSGQAIEKLLERGWENEGIIKSFKGGLFAFFAYHIAHDAHHRGNILLTLKLCGEKIPDKLKWGLWEWK